MFDINELLLNDLKGFHKLSYNKKREKDWKWIEDNARHYSSYYTEDWLEKDQLRKQINYFLANGRGKDAMELSVDPNLTGFALNSQNKSEEFYESEFIQHYDILRRVLTRQWGEQKKRRMKVMAFDTSGYNMNQRKTKRNELIQAYLQQTIYKPLEERVTMEVFQKHGIGNPQDLTPEEQQEVQFEIEEGIKAKSIKDIDKYMRRDYKSISESQIQRLSNWLIEEYNLKFIADEAYKDLTIAGYNCVEFDIINNRPSIKIVNPLNFSFFNPTSSPFISDSEWWISEEHVTFSNFVNEFSGDIAKLKKLTEAVYTNSPVRNQIRGEVHHDAALLAADLAGPPSEEAIIRTQQNTIEYISSTPDINQPGGQEFYSHVLNMFGSNIRHGQHHNTIRKARIVFASLDKVYYVEREDKYNPGNLVGFWVGENYEPNPELDKRVTERWAKALYECKTAGYTDTFYWDKKRCDFQNRSLNDPFTVYAPFEGVEFSKLHGNSARIAPIDLGKPYNDEYNQVKRKIKELDDTDVGVVYQFDASARPDGWSIERFMEAVKRDKLAPIDLNNLDYAQFAGQIFKGINLSNNQDIAAKIERLRYIENECVQAMSYSPSQMGYAPASMTATNNQQNIIQSSYATEDLNSLQRIFEEKLLNGFVNLTRNALRDNPVLRNYILTEAESAEIVLSPEIINMSEIAIKVVNDTQKLQDTASLKNLLQPMIQNQMINLSEAIKLQFNENPAELINLAEEAELRAQQRQEAQAKEQQEHNKRMYDLKVQEDEFNKEIRLMELEIKKLGYILNSEQFAKQMDINQNQKNDLIEKAELEMESKERVATQENELKRELTYAKLQQDYKKLENDLKIAKMNRIDRK